MAGIEQGSSGIAPHLFDGSIGKRYMADILVVVEHQEGVGVREERGRIVDRPDLDLGR